MLKIRSLCIAGCLSLVLSSVASAQETDTQTFNVDVPVSLSIAAPTASETITHDETDDDQSFAVQTWDVAGNPGAGVNVSFSTGSAFTHNTNSAFKADVKLNLTVKSESGADFTVPTFEDTTSIAGSDETATVVASSDGPGTAELDLAVTFITGAFTDLAAGTYSTTVTGTISSN